MLGELGHLIHSVIVKTNKRKPRLTCVSIEVKFDGGVFGIIIRVILQHKIK